MNIEWYERAIKEDPSGEYCNRCGELNDFYDDLGWFLYFNEDEEEIVVCRYCWEELGLSTCER